MKNIEIITPRLLIRVPRMEDVAEINAGLNSIWHDLQLWTSFAYEGQNTIEATQEYIAAEPNLEKEDGRLPLIGICRKTGRFAVSSGLHMEGAGRMATGYWVPAAMRGQRYAEEACGAVIRYAFNVLGIPAMHICHYAGNGPSERIIRKLGFIEDGIRRNAKARCLDGTLLDVHDYIMPDPAVLPSLQVEWRQRCP